MFCDGACKKRNKTCGLLTTITLTHNQTGEVSILDKCVFIAMMESMMRQESHNVGIQAAVESSRNEQVKSSREQNKTIAKGFLGLVDTINENAEAARELGYLGDAVDAELIEEE